jgi:hypothetical protein
LIALQIESRFLDTVRMDTPVTLKAEQLDGVSVIGVGTLSDVLGDPSP